MSTGGSGQQQTAMMTNKSGISLFSILLLTAIAFSAHAQFQQGAAAPSARDLERLFIDALQARLMGDLDEATSLFERVLEQDPENGAAAYELARIYDAKDEPGKALIQAGNAVESDPQNTWYQTFLAQVLEDADQPLQAAEIYEALHEKEPDNDYYLFMEAYLLVVGQQVDQAIRVYDDLERRVGVVPEISNKKIRLYLGMGKQDKAVSELRQLAEAYPSHLECRHELAELFVSLNQREQALEVYREILQADPSDAKARFAVSGGPALPQEANPDERLQTLFADPDVPIDLKIKQILPLVNQASNAPGTNAALKLLPLCDAIREAHPSEAKAHALSGDVLGLSGKTTEAISAYQQALKFDKSVFAVWEQLMVLLLEQNAFAELLEVSEESLDLFPNQALSYYLNGLAALRTESFPLAISSLQQASIMSSRMPGLYTDVLNSLGEAQFRNGQPDRGSVTFEKAIALAPQAVALMANYAVQLAESSQYDKARRILEEAEKTDPSHPGVLVVKGLLALREESNPAVAKKHLLGALDKGVKDAFVFEMLGDVFLQLDDAENATRYWQLALEQGGNPERLNARIQTQSISN